MLRSGEYSTINHNNKKEMLVQLFFIDHSVLLLLVATDHLMILKFTSMKNNTEVTDFILLALTNASELQGLLFIMFTLIYFVTLDGNWG